MDLETGYPQTPNKTETGYHSGSYNVTLPRKNKRTVPITYDSSDDHSVSGCILEKCCKCIIYACALLFMMLIGLLVFAAIVYFLWTIIPTPSVSTSDLASCNVSSTLYQKEEFVVFSIRFHKSYSNLTDECGAFSTYMDKSDELGWSDDDGVNGTARFGMTTFADWTLEQRSEYGGSSTTELSFKSTPKGWHKESLPPTLHTPIDGIHFYDDCDVSWNIRWVLSRLQEQKGSDGWFSTQDNSCSTNTNVKMLPVYEITPFNTMTSKNSTNHMLSAWLYLYGPFVTTLAVPSQFYDYRGGVYSVSQCGTDMVDTLVHVVVFGYGIDKPSGLSYWTVWPIGQKWADWGEAGTMRLEMGACVPEGLPPNIIAAVQESVTSH